MYLFTVCWIHYYHSTEKFTEKITEYREKQQYTVLLLTKGPTGELMACVIPSLFDFLFTKITLITHSRRFLCHEIVLHY